MTHTDIYTVIPFIAMVAEMLNKATDDDAIVGRYGGDEFFVFLKSSRIAENADRVVDNVCKINISDDKRITCSVGVATAEYLKKCLIIKRCSQNADKHCTVQKRMAMLTGRYTMKILCTTIQAMRLIMKLRTPKTVRNYLRHAI